MTADRPEVLFVCVHNAGRSQMAAALLAHHAEDRVVVRSAGSAPADDINPAVVEAMAEIGIDLRASGAHPKKLDEAAVKEVQRNWRFVPGKEDGKPVAMWHTFAVTFRLTD